MSMVKRLIRQLEQRGLSIKPGKEPDQLMLSGPDSEKTPDVIAALKAFKGQLLEIYGTKAQPDLPPAREDAITLPQSKPEPEPPGEAVAPQTEPYLCGVCKATLYTTNATDIAQTCEVSGCPFVSPIRSSRNESPDGS